MLAPGNKANFKTVKVDNQVGTDWIITFLAELRDHQFELTH